MKQTKVRTYKVEMDAETMRDIKDLIYFCRDHFPFTKSSLWTLHRELEDILRHGCFKHNILTKHFRISPSESIWICPKCDPKRYNELKKEYGEK